MTTPALSSVIKGTGTLQVNLFSGRDVLCVPVAVKDGVRQA